METMSPTRSASDDPSADSHPHIPASDHPPPPPPPPRPPTPPARRDTRMPLYTVPAHKRLKLIERSSRAQSATYAILSQDLLVKDLAYTSPPSYEVKGSLDCNGLPYTGSEFPLEEQRLVCKLCSAEVRPRDGFTLLGSWVKHKKRCGERVRREKARLEERQRAAREAMERIKREKREAKKPQKQERDAKEEDKKAKQEQDGAQGKNGDSPPAETPEEEEREKKRDSDDRVTDWAEKVGASREAITQSELKGMKKRRDQRDAMVAVAAAMGILSGVEGGYMSRGDEAVGIGVLGPAQWGSPPN